MGSINERRDSGYGANERYTTLTKPFESAPPVIVFFSFLDPVSFDWNKEHNVVQTIRKALPNGTEVDRYHTSLRWSWNFGEELTHAWAVADTLSVDDQLIRPMFEAVANKKVHDLEGIRTVFDQIGIPPAKFLEEWGNIRTLKFAEAMNNAARELGIEDVPCIVVKGKYLVTADEFGEKINAQEVADVVKDLLEKE